MSRIKDMTFEERVEMGKALVVGIYPSGFSTKKHPTHISSTHGVEIDFISQGIEGRDERYETIMINYETRGFGVAYHIYDHYRSLFGDSCEVHMQERGKNV